MSEKWVRPFENFMGTGNETLLKWLIGSLIILVLGMIIMRAIHLRHLRDPRPEDAQAEVTDHELIMAILAVATLAGGLAWPIAIMIVLICVPLIFMATCIVIGLFAMYWAGIGLYRIATR